MTPEELRSVLGDGDFRFRMGLTRVDDVSVHLRRIAESPAVRALRTATFEAEPRRAGVDAGLDPTGRRRVRDALDHAEAWAGAAGAEVGGLAGHAASHATDDASLRARCVGLSRALCADVLLVDRATRRIDALAMAFPTGFAPEACLGRTVAEVHRPVPGLEPALGAKIAAFLDRIPRGSVYRRDNLGLCRGPSRDRHPARGAPRIDADTPRDALYLRLEMQAFVGLDEATVLFAIGLVHEALEPWLASEGMGEALARWLATQPPEVRTYKGLAALPQEGFRSEGASGADPHDRRGAT